MNLIKMSIIITWEYSSWLASWTRRISILSDDNVLVAKFSLTISWDVLKKENCSSLSIPRFWASALV